MPVRRTTSSGSVPEDGVDEAKAQRLKAALRDNLRRRKRARAGADEKVSSDTDRREPVRQTDNDGDA
jgi:hypothetical protein